MKIGDVFKKKAKALIAYVTVGYPSVEATRKIVPLLEENGADIIELGIPFSDPIGDGPVIQGASFRALKSGVTTRTCLEVASRLKKKTTVPLVFMSYYNPIYCYGISKFCVSCAKSGIAGLIVPDLPPEEAGELEAACLDNGIDNIFLLSPASTEERIRLVAARSRGFIYLTSVTGVTGARERLPDNLSDFIRRVRGMTAQPLCVGFGVSSAAQAKEIAGLADGVIIGSRIIQLLTEDNDYSTLTSFIREIRKALDS